VRPPRAAEPKGGKETVLNEKSFDFLCSKNYKLLSQIKGKPIKNCFIFNFVIFVTDWHCDHSPRAPHWFVMSEKARNSWLSIAK